MLKSIKTERGDDITLDAAPISSFLASKPIDEKQLFTLCTYAIAREPTNGIHGVVKMIGVFPSERDAELYSKTELKKDHCKLVKIMPTGTWLFLRNPLSEDRTQYDHFTNGEVKRIVSRMNADIHNKETEEEREMRTATEKLKLEAQKPEDKDSPQYFAILKRRVEGIDPMISSYKQQIARLSHEIEKLRKLKPEITTELELLVQRHPEYTKMLEEIEKQMTSE